MGLFAPAVLTKLSKIMMKLSKKSSDELIMAALKKTNKKMLIQTKLIKNIILRVEELEERAEEKDEEISFIHRIFESS